MSQQRLKLTSISLSCAVSLHISFCTLLSGPSTVVGKRADSKTDVKLPSGNAVDAITYLLIISELAEFIPDRTGGPCNPNPTMAGRRPSLGRRYRSRSFAVIWVSLFCVCGFMWSSTWNHTGRVGTPVLDETAVPRPKYCRPKMPGCVPRDISFVLMLESPEVSRIAIVPTVASTVVQGPLP